MVVKFISTVLTILICVWLGSSEYENFLTRRNNGDFRGAGWALMLLIANASIIFAVAYNFYSNF